MAFDATLAGENSNSLVSVARAVELINDLPPSAGINQWLALGETQQEKTLVASTFSIDSLPWKGDICSTVQALAWPRRVYYDGQYTYCDAIPRDVELAVAYTAAFMGEEGGYVGVGDGGGESESDSAPFPGLTPADLQGYEQVDLGNGALKLKLTEQSGIKTGVTFIPAFAADLLRKYINSAQGFKSTQFRNNSVGRIQVPYINPFNLVVRESRVIYDSVNNKLYPKTGGWLSNPPGYAAT